MKRPSLQRADRAPGRCRAGGACFAVRTPPAASVFAAKGCLFHRLIASDRSRRPLDRDRWIAVEEADETAAVQVQHAGVEHVRAGGPVFGKVPGDAAVVFDNHRTTESVEDAAAITAVIIFVVAGGHVSGNGATIECERTLVVNAAAVVVGGVAGDRAVANHHGSRVVNAAAV